MVTSLYGGIVDDYECHELCFASFVVVLVVSETFAIMEVGFEFSFHVGGRL